MNFLVNMVISAIAILISAFLIPGIQVDGFISALLVAVVLAVLNRIIKPLLVVFTLPITILTLGLFYLVINVMLIYIADWIVGPGFTVKGFFPALFFSIVLSVVNSVLDAMAGEK
jgi:putative membrane protein